MTRSGPPQIFGLGRRDEPFLSGSGGRFSSRLVAEVDFWDRKRRSFDGGWSSLALAPLRSLIFPPGHRCPPSSRLRGRWGRGLAAALWCVTGFCSAWLEG